MLEDLLRFVLTERATAAQDAAVGKPKDWDEYRWLVGRIKAFDEIIDKYDAMRVGEKHPLERS